MSLLNVSANSLNDLLYMICPVRKLEQLSGESVKCGFVRSQKYSNVGFTRSGKERHVIFGKEDSFIELEPKCFGYTHPSTSCSPPDAVPMLDPDKPHYLTSLSLFPCPSSSPSQAANSNSHPPALPSQFPLPDPSQPASAVR